MTRLKTVEYAFPVLASATNNTLTDFTQITIDLPDVDGATSFKSVVLRVTADDIITATGGTTNTKTIAGDISGSSGGTVDISVYRTSTGEKILEGSRSGDGAYSFTWFDDIEDVYVSANETNTKTGRSADDLV